MNIVCFGQQNWDHCWTGKQQLMTRLAARGHRVLYVDPVWQRESRTVAEHARALAPVWSGSGVRQIQPGLHVYTYQFVPLIGMKANAHRRWFAVRQLAKCRLGMAAPLAVVFRPDAGWIMRAVRPVASIYYAVDEWTAFGGYTDADRARMRRQEEELLRQSELALAVSPRLRQRFASVQPRSYVLQNGADLEHFSMTNLARVAPHPDVRDLPRPRLCFVGQVDERLDQPLLVRLATAHPEWQIVLAGRIKQGVDVAALRAQSNIRLLGYQPYERLPGILREAEACLVPYRLTDLTQSCNPLKVFEYLATGRPVVSVPLEGLGACRGAVRVAESADAFQSAVEAALADPANGREARLRVAAENTWDHRVDELEARLEEALEVAAAKGTQRAVALRGASIRPDQVRLDAKDDAVRRVKESFRPQRPSVRERMAFNAARAGGWVYYGLRLGTRMALGRRPAKVRRILVARLGYLGDLVALLPMLAALRARYPHAHIVLGVQPGMASGTLLEGSGYVDEVRVLDFLSRPSRVQKLRGAASLFLEGFDLLISGVAYCLLREPFFCGAPLRIGLYDGHPVQNLNGRVVPLDPIRHESDNNLAIVEALGARPDAADRVPRLHLPVQATRAAFAQLAIRLNLPSGVRLLAMHPGSKWESRRWPGERFAELIARLLEAHPDVRVVITGTPGESKLVESIRSAVPERLRGRALNAAGLTDLPMLVGLIDESAAVVSNDTGMMHLARTRATPLVALLGPENDRRWGPQAWGTAPAVALRYDVPCAPCARLRCEEHYCMRSISVDQVLHHVERFLSPPPGAVGQDDGAHPPRRIPLTQHQPERPPLQRLERHSTRTGWEELAARGFRLPLVTVIAFDAPGADGPAEQIRRSLATLSAQDYPRIELILLHKADANPAQEQRIDALLEQCPFPARTIAVASDDVRSGWIEATELAEGEFIAAMNASSRWPPRKISEDVASLVRAPKAVAVGAPELVIASKVLSSSADLLDLTARRDAVKAVLATERRRSERLDSFLVRQPSMSALPVPLPESEA